MDNLERGLGGASGGGVGGREDECDGLMTCCGWFVQDVKSKLEFGELGI